MRKVSRPLVLALIGFTLFVFGYGFGVNQLPKPVEGVYNLEYWNQSDKVVITTKINYIEQEQKKLIIYGEPVFEEVN